MNRAAHPLIVALAFFLALSPPSFSQEQAQPEEQEQQPEGTYETAPASLTRFGDTGFFDVFSAYTILRYRVAVAGFRDNIDRDPQNFDISNFAGSIAVGLSHRVELFARVEAQTRIDGDALEQPGFYNDQPRVFPGAPPPTEGWATGFGDVSIGAKVNLLSEYRDNPVGLAVRGFIKAPTADDDEGLGTGEPSGGAHVVLSKNLGEQVESSYYAGFRANGDPDEVNIGNAFEWGLGFRFPRDAVVKGTAELTGTSFGDAAFDQTDPVDLLLGLTIQMDNGFFLTAAWRHNLNFDQEDETASGFNFGIGFHPGVRGRFIPAPPPEPPVNRPPTVTVTANPPEIEEGASSRVVADASDPDGDPLTYAWRAPDGRIEGEGAEVIWHAPEGVEGSYPVTVTVDDGRGGTASDTTNIRVRRRVVKEIEFQDVHFLFDRYDLTEEARRILDEAAEQLKQNPDLRIEIEGHCCNIATEEYNLSLGARRAEAVRDYLVRLGIDPGRLTTVSYGESRPAYDNSREVTRRLNRRAHLRVLVTEPQD